MNSILLCNLTTQNIALIAIFIKNYNNEEHSARKAYKIIFITMSS